MLSDLSHGKMLDFISLPLFRFTLIIKLTNFGFEIFFDEKSDVRFEYVLSNSV